VSEIPGDRSLEALPERCPSAEVEALCGAIDVETTSRLPSRLLRIPDEPAFETCHVGDEQSEIANGDLLAGAQVDRLGPLILGRRAKERFRAVLDIQELARRRAVSP